MIKAGGRALYILGTGGPHIEADTGDAAKFFTSFRPTGAETPVKPPTPPIKPPPPTVPVKPPPATVSAKPPSPLLGPSEPDDVNNLRADIERTTHFLFPALGETLVTAGKDGKLKVWELPTLRLKAEAETLSGIVNHLVASRDGHTLAVAGGVRVVVHDAATGRQRQTFEELKHRTGDKNRPVIEGLGAVVAGRHDPGGRR